MSEPAYAFGGPPARGVIKQTPEDFIVEEIPSFEASGSGEHVFLHIEKQGENTDHVAKTIARYAGLPRQAVSYAGLKDRHGRTIQWFSVHIPGKHELDWQGLNGPSLKVLAVTRNDRKLRKGALKGNRFEICIREVQGERAALEQQLQAIKRDGVPNYFGPQRFGHGGRNVDKARALFTGELTLRDRHLQGIYLSAARAHLFNCVLARRVSDSTWNQAITGDVFMFADSHSFFRDELTEDVLRRVAALDIQPSGPLWGKGELATSEDAMELEMTILEEEKQLCDGLMAAGMDMARRPLRLPVADLSWDFPSADVLRLRFVLPAGAYATTVLREAITVQGQLDE